MDINTLGLEGEMLVNVTKLIQSENDKIRTEYTTKMKDLEQYKPVVKSDSEKALDERLKALETKEQDMNKRERLNNVSEKMKEKGLNEGLSKYLNVSDDCDLETYISEVASIIGNQSTYIPKGHSDKSTGNTTKTDFNKMNYNERSNLFNTNKTLYDILSK